MARAGLFQAHQSSFAFGADDGRLQIHEVAIIAFLVERLDVDEPLALCPR